MDATTTERDHWVQTVMTRAEELGATPFVAETADMATLVRMVTPAGFVTLGVHDDPSGDRAGISVFGTIGDMRRVLESLVDALNHINLSKEDTHD